MWLANIYAHFQIGSRVLRQSNYHPCVGEAMMTNIDGIDNFETKHDDIIRRKHFPRYWSLVQGIHRSAANSPHKGQWGGALMISLICLVTKNRAAGDCDAIAPIMTSP